MITPVEAWPEFFDGLTDEGDPDAFPATDADMSGFELEEATPDSFARDMALLEALEANQQLTIREEDPPPFPRLPGAPDDLEWTLPDRDLTFRGLNGPSPHRREREQELQSRSVRAL